MKSFSIGTALLMALPVVFSLAQPAQASKSRLDVDIEDLDAEIRWDGQKWSLRVEYDVEIEDAAPNETFDLVLNLVNRTNAGQPVQIVVPLVSPSEVDDEEFEYESAVVARLDAGLVGDPDHVKVHAVVVRHGGGEVLDQDKTSVKHRH